jgi:hypothetical protein
MRILIIKAFSRMLFLLLVMAALLFIPAGTLDYWQAWTFMAVYFASYLAITVYLIRYDPKLLERRINGGPTAAKDFAQKIITFIAAVAFVGLIVLPALDHRFMWSHVPLSPVLAGDALVALGWLAFYLVFRENSFTSATIEVAPDQKGHFRRTVCARAPPNVRRDRCDASWHTDLARFVVGAARHRRDDPRSHMESARRGEVSCKESAGVP